MEIETGKVEYLVSPIFSKLAVPLWEPFHYWVWENAIYYQDHYTSFIMKTVGMVKAWRNSYLPSQLHCKLSAPFITCALNKDVPATRKTTLTGYSGTGYV